MFVKHGDGKIVSIVKDEELSTPQKEKIKHIQQTASVEAKPVVPLEAPSTDKKDLSSC